MYVIVGILVLMIIAALIILIRWSWVLNFVRLTLATLIICALVVSVVLSAVPLLTTLIRWSWL